MKLFLSLNRKTLTITANDLMLEIRRVEEGILLLRRLKNQNKS